MVVGCVSRACHLSGPRQLCGITPRHTYWESFFGLPRFFLTHSFLRAIAAKAWAGVNVIAAVVFLAPWEVHAQVPNAESDRYSIVNMGTSLTLRGNWTASLASAIGQCIGFKTVATIVAGAGQNSAWGLTQLHRVLAAEPDLVTVEFAINDASLIRGLSVSQSAKNLEFIISTIKETHPEATIIIITTNPVSNWGWITRFALDEFYSVNEEVASKMEVEYIDLRPHWAARDITTDIPDGVHPLPDIAETVFISAIMNTLLKSETCI